MKEVYRIGELVSYGYELIECSIDREHVVGYIFNQAQAEIIKDELNLGVYVFGMVAEINLSKASHK